MVGQVKELHEGHGFVVDNAAPTDMLYFDYSHNPLVSSVALSRTIQTAVGWDPREFLDWKTGLVY